MPVEGHIGVGSSWKEHTEVHIGVGSAWKDCTECYVGVGGAWEQWFSATTVTLSGEGAADLVFSGNAIAGFRVNADGTIDKRVGGTYSQISPSTDWIIPNGDASSDYDIRVTSLVGDAWTSGAASEDVWIDLGSDREWYWEQGPAVGTKFATFDLEIRDGTGTTVATGTYTADVERA